MASSILGIDGSGRNSHNRLVERSPKSASPGEPTRLVPSFAIRTVRRGSAIVVEVSGEIDLYSASWLAEELRICEGSSLEIVVDLEGVEFMDCSGLRVLLAAAERCVAGRFSVTPGSRQVQRLFELIEASEHLRVVAPPSWHESAAVA